VLQGVVQKDNFRDYYNKFSPPVCYWVKCIIPVILFALHSLHDLSPHAKQLELISFYTAFMFVRIQVSLSLVNYCLVHRNSQECFGKDLCRNGEINTKPGHHARLGNTWTWKLYASHPEPFPSKGMFDTRDFFRLQYCNFSKYVRIPNLCSSRFNYQMRQMSSIRAGFHRTMSWARHRRWNIAFRRGAHLFN
jgi:hypothetical protein